MKLKIVSTLGISLLAFGFSACSTAPATTNTNATANKAVVANTANTNTTAPTNTAESNTTAAVEGDVVKIDEAGIMMVVPKGFKFSKDGEDTVVMTEDEGVDIRFTVPKDGDYNKVVMDAAKEVDEYLNDVKVEDKGSEVNVNGMKGTSMSGTATNEGEPVNWDLTIIDAPKKPVLANIYAEKSSLEKHGAAVKKFLESVKKQ